MIFGLVITILLASLANTVFARELMRIARMNVFGGMWAWAGLGLSLGTTGAACIWLGWTLRGLKP